MPIMRYLRPISARRRVFGINDKTIYFVRHGRTEWNAIGRMQGQMNSSLDAVGRRQAEVHGRLLAAVGVDSVIASPLDRARQTVEIVGRFVEVAPVFDPRVMEWDCGDWSGQLRAEVRQRWPGEWAALEADPYHYRGPRCENYPDMIARVRPFVDELVSGPGRRIAVISHGMIGRIMVGLLMSFGEPEMLAFRQPNQVIYRVRLGPGAETTAAVADKGALVAAAMPERTGPRSGPARLDHFVGGLGPFEGVVPR